MTFIHETSICKSNSIGSGTRIWAFTNILEGAKIGSDCNICDGVFIENDVVVGDRVTVKCGVQLWDGLRVADDVFIGPNATFANDKHPRSRMLPPRFATTTLGKNSSIGANATILPGVEIGQGAMIGAGAIVTRDVPPNAVVVGNPARVVSFSDATQQPEVEAGLNNDDFRPKFTADGVELLEFQSKTDSRGGLTVIDYEKDLPFKPVRTFFVRDVPPGDFRGAHAHKECQQLLVLVRGSLKALVDDGEKRDEVVLSRPEQGLYMPAMTWGTQFNYSDDAVLMVMASHPYQADDYIHSYEEFLECKSR